MSGDITIITEGEKYEKVSNQLNTDETRGNSASVQKKEVNFWEALSDLGNLRLPKMVLVLLFADYAVISFSKGESGIVWFDFLYFISFSVFSVFLFVSLIFFRSVWSKYNEHILRKFKKFVK